MLKPFEQLEPAPRSDHPLALRSDFFFLLDSKLVECAGLDADVLPEVVKPVEILGTHFGRENRFFCFRSFDE